VPTELAPPARQPLAMPAPAAREGLWRPSALLGSFPANRAFFLLLMPIYEYRCPKGHTFELFQRMSDDPPGECQICGESPVEKVLYPAAIHFKGSGFYSTDYGRGGRKREGAKEGEGGSKDGGSSDSGDSKPADKKPEPKKAAEA
jgi:putative FmdB family regulatory protein